MHVPDTVGILHRGHIPRQIEFVGGTASLIKARMGDRREISPIGAGSQGHPRRFGVSADLVAAGIAAEPCCQFGFMP